MTTYINLETQQLKTESEIRSENPATSYPHPFPLPDGYAIVFDAPQPTYDRYSQTVSASTPVLTDKGHWEQTWLVTEITGDDLVAAQERKAIDEQAAKRNLAEQSLIEFAKQKDFDLSEVNMMLNSSVQTWIDEATKFNQLWSQTWQAFYDNQPLPELVW